MRREKCCRSGVFHRPQGRLAGACGLLPVLMVSLLWTCPARGQVTINPEDDMSRKVSYDEVIGELVKQFDRGQARALDAATKLSSMGRKAVPILANVMMKHKDLKVRQYAAMALGRIRHKSAARALLPHLKDEKADKTMRLIAIGAVSAEGLDEAIGELKKIAKKTEDGDLRFKTLLALSVMN